MGKYDKFNPTVHAAERPWEIHPIWRGIGCLMGVLIPIIAYAASVLLVEANMTEGWVPAPFELIQTVEVPMIGPVEHLFANLIVTVLLSLVGFGLLTILYSILYSVVGPPRYGPLDAPPQKPRRRR
jgi:hypothetical protein